ncbi:hypothetical protein PbB2_01543 [Candidatus Phycosocius bacilliformis]|uniref:Exopolysaccharide synthesis, ExoD n=1 Tax=Candidatus Phycosocius bacilliformis TaxID=1445552 RepID=A0A2P2EA04_9PROT|nr:exopolysaccharide biosynthesis protein [Candidatus Phycosocius bacilliformis]GBF57873.1 hypothetical protein PbB2_01543 [Candidatus Phycosocius bacilliformis]
MSEILFRSGPCSAQIAPDIAGRAPSGPPNGNKNLRAALPPKTSDLLRELHDAFPGDEQVSVRDVLKRLDGRAFGLLLLILALPNCIPNVPGISTIFGILLVAPALQMIFGAGTPWIPKRVGDLKIDSVTFRKVIDVSLPTLLRIEKLVQPRFQFLTQKPATIWFGVQTLILAGILTLPIPLGNWPPGMSIAALAIGLLQRDGLMALVSFGFFLVSLAVAPLGIGMAIAGLNWLLGVAGDVWHLLPF